MHDGTAAWGMENVGRNNGNNAATDDITVSTTLEERGGERQDV